MQPGRIGTHLHLRAALIALLVVAIAVAVAVRAMNRLEDRWIYALAPETCELKSQTISWQEAAFEKRDLLPLYGSSELIGGISTCASRFFAKRPTGFIVSPVGRGACTSLIIAQRLGAVAHDARDRKLAIIVSPSWFMTPSVPVRRYAGNFSPYQANTLIFSSPLSMGLKRDMARRLLDYEETLINYPVLHSAVRQLTDDHPWSRAAYWASLPIGTLHNMVYALQDRVQITEYLRNRKPVEKRLSKKGKSLDWDKLTADTVGKGTIPITERVDGLPLNFASDAEYQQILLAAPEWHDLELLLRTIKELRLDALLLAIPIERPHFEAKGISRASIDLYYQGLKKLADRYHVKLEDNEEHQDDPYFFEDHHDHISAKAWMIFNRKLDRFFHHK